MTGRPYKSRSNLRELPVGFTTVIVIVAPRATVIGPVPPLSVRDCAPAVCVVAVAVLEYAESPLLFVARTR